MCFCPTTITAKRQVFAETQKHSAGVFLRLVPHRKHSGMNDDAAQITVEDDPAIHHGTAVPEKIQDTSSHFWAEPLVEVLFRYTRQQLFASLAVRVEALADIHGVGDVVVLVPEAQ